MLHNVKCIEPFYTDVKEGRKWFELRLNDRNYAEGDVLHLLQFIDGQLTGYSMFHKVTYVLKDFKGIEKGYCIMGIGTEEAK